MSTYPAIPALALVRRELVTTLRRPRSFVFLAVFCLACIGVALTNWPAQGLTLQMAGSTSRSVFMILAEVVWVAAVLLVPGLAAGTISLEREQDTYDQLNLSLISPSGVVMAKLFNAVGYFLFLWVSIVPIVSALLFLVGLDAWQVMHTALIILLSLSTCAAIGLACSAAIPKTAPAIVVTYLAVLVALVGVGTLVSAMEPTRSDEVLALVPALLLYRVITLAPSTYLLMLTALYHLAIATGCLVVATRCLRRAPKPARVSKVKVIDDAAIVEARRHTFPFYLIDPLRRRAPIADNINPVLAKEIRWGWFTRATTLIRVFYVTAFVFLVACAQIISSGTKISDAVYAWVMIECALVVLVAPTLMANAFAKEYEMQNIDMLRMTLLGPRDIVRGKVVAALIATSPLLFAGACSTLLLLVAAFLASDGFLMTLTGTLTFFSTAFLALALGLTASVLTRRTGASLVFSYGLQMFVFLLLPLMVFLATNLSRAATQVPNPYVNRAEDARMAASTSPVLTYMVAADKLKQARRRGNAPFYNPDRDFDYYYWQSGTILAVLISLGLVGGSAVYFARRRMRDP